MVSENYDESTLLPDTGVYHGGALRCRGGPHPRYIFRGKRGLF